MRHRLVLPALLVLSFATGCASRPRHNGPYTPQANALRNPLEAQRLTQDAAELILTKPETAERLLLEALGHNLYHGPAHNNLGIIYLERGMLYEAVGEFEWARKLMPGHPDPRINLGIALEQAGRIGEAIEAYQTALESRPEHIYAMQVLARCQLKHGRTDLGTEGLLREIALRGSPAEWRDWARRARVGLDDTPAE